MSDPNRRGKAGTHGRSLWTLENHTFLAGLRCHELSAPWIIDEPITRLAFETYIETQLAPSLHKGDVAILDNLAVHKSEKAALCLKRQGA